MKKLDEDFLKAIDSTRRGSGKRMRKETLAAMGMSKSRNPRVPQRIEKMAAEIASLTKHVKMYSGIDAKHAARLGRDAAEIAEHAVFLAAYADWIIQNPRDQAGAERHAEKAVKKARRHLW